MHPFQLVVSEMRDLQWRIKWFSHKILHWANLTLLLALPTSPLSKERCTSKREGQYLDSSYHAAIPHWSYSAETPQTSVPGQGHRLGTSLFVCLVCCGGGPHWIPLLIYDNYVVNDYCFIYDKLFGPKDCRSNYNCWTGRYQKVYSLIHLLSGNEEREENWSITQKTIQRDKSFLPPPLCMCYGSNCIPPKINSCVEVLTHSALEHDLMWEQDPCACHSDEFIKVGPNLTSPVSL